jgi:serine/threonine-protein kinase
MAPNRMEATALVRPPQSGSKLGLIIAGALVGLAVLGGAAAFLLIPRNGRVEVTVKDSKGAAVPGEVKIFVDGKKVCDTAPCTFEVASGPHDVKAEADKYDPAQQSVKVEARKEAKLEIALSGGAKATGLKVGGPQRGVKLVVDGNEVGPLPQELKELTAGEHKLKFVGSERYATLEQTVNVGSGEIKDLGDVTLKVVKGKATITLGTAGAKVSMVSSTGDRRDLPTFPISVEIEPAKATWTIEATKAGFTDYKQAISFDDGQAEKVFDVALTAKGAATATPTTTTPSTTTSTPVATTTPKPSGGGEAKFALITALPPKGSICLVDRKPIGVVPKTDLATTPGSHTVRCINKEEGLDKTIDVTVGAGESKKVVVKLRD